MKSDSDQNKVILTNEQRKRILGTLSVHGIRVEETSSANLISEIENQLSEYQRAAQVKGMKSPSRSQVLREIEALRTALQSLSEGSRGVLVSACLQTERHKDFIQGDLRINKSSIPENMDFCIWLYRTGISQLIEACKLTLSKTPIKLGDTSMTAFEFWTNTKTGRPRDPISRSDLCISLANSFQRWTKRKPTDTQSGAFDDFLSACLQIVEPTRSERGHTNKKLIRNSLEKYNEPPPSPPYGFTPRHDPRTQHAQP